MLKGRRHFAQRVQASTLRGQLIRGGLGSLALKIAAMALGLVLAVTLARTLGPEAYGTYAYVIALVSLVAVPAQLGLPNVVVRETAKAQALEKWGLMRGLWRWAFATAAGIGLCLAAIGLAAAGLLGTRITPLQFSTFSWGLVLVPLTALVNICAAALRGLRRVVVGQLPDSILRPGLLVVFILAGLVIWPRCTFSARDAMALHACAAAAAFAISAYLLRRARPTSPGRNVALRYEPRDWLRAAFPLALVSGMQLVNQHTDLLMLGLFSGSDEVGIYRVAVSGAALVPFGLGAITMVTAPHFARLHSQGDMTRLQRVVTMSARATLALTLPVALAFVAFGGSIIELLFGPAYVEARIALAILALGQLVNAVAGPVGTLLTMTGHERDTARGMATAAAANVILNLILIPRYGKNGAAAATAISILLWNSSLLFAVKRRLGITMTPLSARSFQRASHEET